MAFVCPHAKLRSLPRGLPAVGLGTRGRADLMNFYATTYAVAHAQPPFQPFLGHHTVTGYVPNNEPAMLRAAEGDHQDATSTTMEHFKPFLLLDGRSLLPGQVHRAESGYFQAAPLSWLHIRGVSPQGPQQAPRERGTSPEILQKMTIGTVEQSGFSRATRRTPNLLPTLPGQPRGLSVTASDYLPSLHSHGHEMLPVVPTGSERGSGFSREVPTSLGTTSLPKVGHPLPLVFRGRLAPPVPPKSVRKEPSGFTTNHGRYVPPVAPPAPAQPRWVPTWMTGPVGSIQPQRPSGFSTNNHPTGDIVTHPPRDTTPRRVLLHPGGTSPQFCGISPLPPPKNPWEHKIKPQNNFPGHSVIVTSVCRVSPPETPGCGSGLGGCLHPDDFFWGGGGPHTPHKAGVAWPVAAGGLYEPGFWPLFLG